jgi:hypothetical protein
LTPSTSRCPRSPPRASRTRIVLGDGWLKVFTVLYQLIGTGILVEVLRRLGIAFIAVRAQERAAKPPRE